MTSESQKHLCMYADFRKLNKVSRRTLLPIPTVDLLMHRLAGHDVYAVLTLKKMQIPLEPGNELPFGIESGTYEFKYMPFGIRSSSSVYQKKVNKALKNYTNAIAIIDNILVFAKKNENTTPKSQASNSNESIDKHIKNVKRSLKRVNLQMHTKCTRGTVIDVFGYRLCSEDILPQAKKMNEILALKPPEDLEQLQAFLRFTGHYQMCVAGYAHIVAPLYELKSQENFTWTDECYRAYVTLRNQLVRMPTLCFPDLKEPFIVRIESTERAIIAQLLQVAATGKRQTILHASRIFYDFERSYNNIEKGALSLYWALTKKFVHFLQGGTLFFLEIDPDIIFFLQQAEVRTNARFARWALSFKKFEPYCIDQINLDSPITD